MPLRTLIIYNPSIEKGGVEKNIKNLLEIKEFVKNFNIKIVSIERFKLKPKNINFVIPEFFSIFLKIRLLKYLAASFFLFVICAKKKAIIFSFQNNIFAICIAILTNNKIIIRLNTAPQKYITNFFKKKIFTFFYRQANIILCNSLEFKKYIKKYFNINALLLRNFVNIKKILTLQNARCKEIFFKNKNCIKLLTIGRLVNQKNQILLLKALTLLKFRYKLIIIGDGVLKKKLIEYINKNNLEEKVKIIPHLINPYPYIKKSDIFILSSKFEGMPNVLLESAILKTLILASNCPTGPKELIVNNKYGYLFKNNSKKDLANTLNKIHKKNNVKIINAMYLKIISEYNNKDNINSLLNLINRI